MNQNHLQTMHTLHTTMQTAGNISSIAIEEISRVHRFIHFHIDSQQMNNDTDCIKQQCAELLDVYAASLQSQTGSRIECQTVRYNKRTSQCTLYLSACCNHGISDKWTQVFTDTLNSFQSIPLDRNSLV